MTRLETTLCLICCPRDLVSIPDIMDETVQNNCNMSVFCLEVQVNFYGNVVEYMLPTLENSVPPPSIKENLSSPIIFGIQ